MSSSTHFLWNWNGTRTSRKVSGKRHWQCTPTPMRHWLVQWSGRCAGPFHMSFPVGEPISQKTSHVLKCIKRWTTTCLRARTSERKFSSHWTLKRRRLSWKTLMPTRHMWQLSILYLIKGPISWPLQRSGSSWRWNAHKCQRRTCGNYLWKSSPSSGPS